MYARREYAENGCKDKESECQQKDVPSAETVAHRTDEQLPRCQAEHAHGKAHLHESVGRFEVSRKRRQCGQIKVCHKGCKGCEKPEGYQEVILGVLFL